MQDRPTARELLDAVREFLASDAAPAQDARTAFLLRVAANALRIVERELRLGPEADAAEHARLEALLGRAGGLRELNTVLAARIRRGELDPVRGELIEHLRATVGDKLAISNPAYMSSGS